jgi:hypothetical protein
VTQSGDATGQLASYARKSNLDLAARPVRRPQHALTSTGCVVGQPRTRPTPFRSAVAVVAAVAGTMQQAVRLQPRTRRPVDRHAWRPWPCPCATRVISRPHPSGHVPSRYLSRSFVRRRVGTLAAPPWRSLPLTPLPCRPAIFTARSGDSASKSCARKGQSLRSRSAWQAVWRT